MWVSQLPRALPVRGVTLLLALGGTGMTALAARAVDRAQDADLHSAFDERARTRARAVSDRMNAIENDVVALQSLFLASDHVDADEFSIFAANLLTHGQGRAYEWAPRVGSTERPLFEAAGPTIRTFPTGDPRPSLRAEYFPVRYVEPADSSVLGLDLGSEPERLRAIEAARALGRPVATGGVELAQGGTGILLVAPVPQTGGGTELAGVALSVIRVSDLLRDALSGIPDDGLDVTLLDPVADKGARWMGSYPDAEPRPLEQPAQRFGEERVTMGNHEWRVVCTPRVGAASGAAAWTAAAVFAAGAAVTALVVAYVHLVGRRSAEAVAHSKELSRQADERRSAMEHAQENEARFRALAVDAQVGVYLLQDGRFSYVNPRFAAMFGRTVAEITGALGADELNPEDPGTAEALSATNSPRRELVVAGQVLETYPTPTTAAGRPAVLGTLLDVTERRSAEAEKHRLERLESLGLLAGGIAHDFNNMLAAVVGNISLAQLVLPPGSQANSRLTAANEAAVRAQGLTTQLQTFSRGGAPIRVPTDLRSVLHDTSEFALRGANVRLTLDVPVDLWPAAADGNQISRVIHNLVINASQAMPNGGNLTIRACNERDPTSLPPGPYVTIEVSDEGAGMAPEVRDRVFDPYFTTKASGNGLGLASAYSIVLRHNGTIHVRSTPGVGSTFTVRLPASDAPLVAEEPEMPKPPCPGHLLVMDDEPAVREVSVLLLESLGYTVEAVEHGAAAIDLYMSRAQEGRPFDAVLLDLTVPGGMGGLDAARALLRLDPSAKCIASSGYSADSTMARPGECFVAVLPKPYSRAALAQVMNGILVRPR